MMRIPIAVMAFALVAATAAAQGLPNRFDPARDAARDVAKAVVAAKAQGKRVLVDVGGEWCAWCHILDRFFERDTEARALREAGYVWVKVNWSKENKNVEVLSRWPTIAGYPHLLVLDGEGRVVHSQDTSELEDGNDYDRAKFIAFLKRYSASGR